MPTETQIYCAHEYTLANLDFAQAVEPNNIKISDYMDRCRNLRNSNTPTLPSTLATELEINPFLRTDKASVIRSAVNQGASSTSAVAVFAQLREWKNNF